jgi:hypothetical protein
LLRIFICLLACIFIASIAGVLGVGAVDASDMLTGFSSRGVRLIILRFRCTPRDQFFLQLLIFKVSPEYFRPADIKTKATQLPLLYVILGMFCNKN